MSRKVPYPVEPPAIPWGWTHKNKYELSQWVILSFVGSVLLNAVQFILLFC